MTPHDKHPEPEPLHTPQPPAPQPAKSAITPQAATESSPPDAAPAHQPAPASSPSKSSSPSNPRDYSLILTIAIAAVVFILVAVGAVFAYQHPKKKVATAPAVSQMHHDITAPESPSPQNCVPLAASSLSKASAESAYRNFVKAVVTQNQTCADDLSSSFFLSQAKSEFGAPDGKWITASPQGIRPLWKDLAQLPATLSDTSFTQSAYTRPIVMQQTSSGLQGQPSNNSDQPQGIKLSYPVDISKYTGSSSEKWQVSLSFILQGGKVQVDDLVVEPQP